jgi:hypothetical protein
VLAGTFKPAEPLAKVLNIRRDEPRPVSSAARSNMQHRVEELATQGVICRPNIGRVLAVR